MTAADSTWWTVIRGAAEGRAPDRDVFAHRYDPVIRAYLGARWRHSTLFREIDDAAQEVFVDCFKENGALHRADPDRGSGFRGFLYGVVRNVARRVEERRARESRTAHSRFDPATIEAREEPLSRVFDRAWAGNLLEQAGRLHAERACEAGAERRVELLRLRFGEGLPIREIARLWDADPAHLHREYAKARTEFRTALRDVVETHHTGGPRAIDEECARLAAYFR